jgi:hypothetical protein
MRYLVLFTLASFLPGQQQCAARNDDNTLVTNTTMGGPNLLFGMRLIAEANYTIAAIQVPTGLLDGPGSMAIYDHDAGNDRPNQNISGTGAYTQCRVISWQGAALPTPIAVTQGQVFWVVWGMPNGSRTPLSTNAVGDVPYRGSFDGGLTWNGQNNGATPWPARPYKIRLFCPYPTNPLQPIGVGKTGTNGVPVLHVTGWSAQGNELDINLKQAAPAVPAILAVGTHAQFQVPGIADVYVNPILTVVVTTSGTAGRGVGTAGLPLVIPARGTAGFPLAVQWFVLDPIALNGIAHTAGIHTVIN